MRMGQAMRDIRFQRFDDGDLADIWFAMRGVALRHPAQFRSLMEAVATELIDRRGEGVQPWLEERCRLLRQTDSREDWCNLWCTMYLPGMDAGQDSE